MISEEICMICLLVDVAEDQRMAYQHTKRDTFFTTKGVDKLSGAKRMTEALGVDLAHSLGAGDTELDRFLEGVGLAVLVGQANLSFKGKFQTIQLSDSLELGQLLFKI